MLGARIVVEQSSLVNETHLLTPKCLVYSSRPDKKKLGLRGVANIHACRIKLGSRKIFGTILGLRSEKGSEPLL